MKRLNLADPAFAYDPEDPEGFRAGSVRFGEELGAQRTGSTLYELPPGQSICPYHYEYAEEEWLLVLAGHPTLRHPDGADRLDPLDVVCFPVGPAGAHGVRNDTEETVRLLMYSTVSWPAVTVYPDSDKVGVYTAAADDGLLLPRSAATTYYDGEA